MASRVALSQTLTATDAALRTQGTGWERVCQASGEGNRKDPAALNQAAAKMVTVSAALAMRKARLKARRIRA